jgi:hypothetical protein
MSRWALALCVLLVGGCDRDAPKPSTTPPVASSAPLSEPLPAPTVSSRQSTEAAEQARVIDAGALGKLFEIGPAGPAAASPRGVVMITRQDELVLAELKGERLSRVPRGRDAFRLSRGPAIAGEHAYWTSNGRLLRRPLSGGALEVLADDAQSGGRVAALPKTDAHPALAVYLAQRGDDLKAQLWVEGGSGQTLTPEGAAASSVGLAPTASGALALSLEGRTGMTPVHARPLRFVDGKARLDDDVVIWVAGGAQSLTEIAGASRDGDPWAFVPMEQDVTHFGLAQLHVGPKPKMGTPVVWRQYPNGVDPAPLAAAAACKTHLVIYVRPSEARPGSPQELHLSELMEKGLGPSRVIARGHSFADVSLAERPKGLLVSYVADDRTWALSMDCP